VTTSGVADIRRKFAEALREKAKLRSSRLVEAFAHVPRERFLGEGPWSICVLSDNGRPSYERTATSDPAEVYRDALIAIDATRGLNNGEPSSLASWFDTLEVAPGETVVHIGTGTGYYTAILAELVGPSGRVLGFEVDLQLAARARANLGTYAQVAVGSETQSLRERSVDAMFVNCGVTHPAIHWLTSLRVGARLLMPVTAAPEANGIGRGAMYAATRHSDGIAVRFVSRVGIFPCAGQRSDELNRELLAKNADSWGDVRTLRMDRHTKEPSCWLHGAECCLSCLDLKPPPFIRP